MPEQADVGSRGAADMPLQGQFVWAAGAWVLLATHTPGRADETPAAKQLAKIAIDPAAVRRTSATQQLTWDLRAQPIGDALNEFAQKAGLQVVFYTEVSEGITAPALSGTFTSQAALEKLLTGTRLQYEFINDRTVAIRPVRSDSSPLRGAPTGKAAEGMRPFLLAQAQTQNPSSHSAATTDAQSAGPQSEAENPEEARSVLALDDVIVTARRREESLQSTPVAVTALTSEALQVRGVQSVDAVSQFVPNLQFDGAAALSGGAYNATLFIRGIGQNDFAIFSDPGVAMYVDGVYLGRSIGGVIDAVDLARVEVLRGPQGTLFGRNTIGGAVNIVTQPPAPEFGGELAVTGGRFDRMDVKGVLNLPLNDAFLTRWMVASINRDGYAKRLTDGRELGDKDSLVGRVQALWKASDSVNVSLALDGTRARQNSAPLTLIDVAPGGFPFMNIYNAIVAPAQTDIAAPDGSHTVNRAFITGDIDTTWAGGLSVNNLDSKGAAVTVDWNLGAVALKSISAYRDLKAFFARDGDGTPYAFRETINNDDQDQFSQELQLSGLSFEERLTWLLGAYYFRESADETGKANLAIGTFDALEALPASRTFPPGPPARFGGAGNPANVGVDVEVNLFTAVKNKSYALFGQSSYKLTDRWSLTAGLRWTQDEKEMDLIHQRVGSGLYIAPPGTHLTDSWSEVTPKLGIELQASPDVLLYGSYANGFKSGGFNGRPLIGSPAELVPYDPEKVNTYELGAKTTWLERRLTLNMAAFFNQYEDMQLSINATPQNFVRNAGKAESKGAELELVTRLARGVDFNFSAGYLDAKYTELDPQLTTLNPPLTLDKELVKAPEWTLSSGLQYAFDVSTGAITLRGDWSYKSKVYQDVFNDERIAQPAFSVVNAYASFTTSNENWELALFGTNLSDERYRISGNSSVGFGLAESTFAAPREWGVTARYRF
jgi:iron complex outermembrane recepter protein